MKIGNPSAEATAAVGAVRTPDTAARQEAPRAGAAPAATEGAGVQVQLSATASELLGGAGSDFDAEKVARITQAIENGTYRIDAEAIADKLIANAQELLGKVGGR